MRSWIECLFKDGKRGGFAWHQTKNIFCKSMIVGYLEPQMDTDGHR
jgi:hypothetical protein